MISLIFDFTFFLFSLFSLFKPLLWTIRPCFDHKKHFRGCIHGGEMGESRRIAEEDREEEEKERNLILKKGENSRGLAPSQNKLRAKNRGLINQPLKLDLGINIYP